MKDTLARQRIEIEFWRNSKHERPEADSIYNIVNKVSDAAVFLDCLNRHQEKLISNGNVLELGGGKVGLLAYINGYSPTRI